MGEFFTMPGSIKRKLDERLRWTPDFGVWRNFHSLSVFVADELKDAFDFNTYLDGAIKISNALSLVPSFEMKKSTSNRCLTFYKSQEQGFAGHVKGELWQINVEHLHVLDMYYQNGVEHYREINNFWLLNPIEDEELGFFQFYQQHPFCKAFIYLGIESYWNKKITRPKEMKIGNARSASHPLLEKTKYYEWDFMDEQQDMDMWNEWGRRGGGIGVDQDQEMSEYPNSRWNYSIG